MMTVWKYRLDRSETNFSLPYDAEVLSAVNQDEEIVVYVQLNPSNSGVFSDQTHTFVTIETGDVAPEGLTFVDTLTMEDGLFVVHIYHKVV